jgi:hypothetical protein
MGRSEPGLGAAEAALLVIAPPAALDGDGPLTGPRRGRHKVEPVGRAVEAGRGGLKIYGAVEEEEEEEEGGGGNKTSAHNGDSNKSSKNNSNDDNKQQQ